MRLHNKSVLNTAKFIYKLPFMKKVMDTLLSGIFNNKIYRRQATNNYTTGKLGIGEKNRYGIASSWITVDLMGADVNLDFRKKSKLPFKDSSIDIIYCAHVFEHLDDNVLENILFECARVLRSDGCIRVESPDVVKIVRAFKEKNYRFFYNLMNRREKREQSIEEVFMGLLACYIDRDRHVGVPFDPLVMRQKLSVLTEVEFANWALSLLTPDQVGTGGHINAMSVSKLSDLLSKAGFVRLMQADTGISHSSKMLMNLNEIERPHRGYYSVIMEGFMEK